MSSFQAPTEPGLYWYQYYATGQIGRVAVTLHGECLMADLGEIALSDVETALGTWLGRYRPGAPIERLIDSANMQCTICAAPAGQCDCWISCSCGWSARNGEPCGNPATTRCSTRVKFGRYNRRTKRYE